MKAKLTLTIDRALIPRAKRYARGRGVSLSALVESALAEMTAAEEHRSFAERWRGCLQLKRRGDDPRFRALLEKYG